MNLRMGENSEFESQSIVQIASVLLFFRDVNAKACCYEFTFELIGPRNFDESVLLLDPNMIISDSTNGLISFVIFRFWICFTLVDLLLDCPATLTIPLVPFQSHSYPNAVYNSESPYLRDFNGTKFSKPQTTIGLRNEKELASSGGI